MALTPENEHISLPTDGVIRFHSEVNSRGLLLVLKAEGEEKRLLVVGVDTSNEEKLTPTDELRLALDRIPAADRADVLASMGLVERPTTPPDPSLPIASVFELDSIFSDPTPVTYLIEPEIPEGAVVYVAGVPESDKSTLACAWGRDLVIKGYAVLLLDGDRNPRAVILDRFKRLGITADHRRFWVWDSQQKSETPQPDSPRVIDWVRRTRLETGKSPMVIVDSAISFLLPGEDENSSGDMRTLFNRCRAVTDAGGTVLLLHHPGKDGNLRGSSDFAAAADQGFVVTNSPKGAHLLSRLTLKVHKTRYALSADIVYNYDGGRIVRAVSTKRETDGAAGSGTPDNDTTRRLTEMLRANPGIGSRQFGIKANALGVPHNKARRFLDEGVESGKIEVRPVGRKHTHYLREGATRSVDADGAG